MGLPAIADVAARHLFSDRDKMLEQGVPEVTVNHILRIRSAYSHWLQFPSKKDADIVQMIMRTEGISTSQAYQDLRLVKALLGDLNRASKDWHLFRFNERIMKAADKAEASGDWRALVAALDKYAKYNKLDKEDDRTPDYDKIVPMTLAFTDDPEAAGFSRIPNHRERIRKVKEKYWTEEVQDVEYEDIDANIDDIFNSHAKRQD